MDYIRIDEPSLSNNAGFGETQIVRVGKTSLRAQLQTDVVDFTC
jgi:hypothetical protein